MSTSTFVEHLLEKRTLLVTGKGGVGKTSVTAALARIASQSGRRVLAVDIDKTLESPSRLLQLLTGKNQLGGKEPVVVTPTLHCSRLTPQVGQHDFLREQIPTKFLAGTAVRSKHLNRFLMAAPGFQETGLIYRLLVYLRRMTEGDKPLYDFVLVDLPATGHALALTSLPQPLLRVFSSGPIERTIREAQAMFNDAEMTGCLVVTLPEPLPVSETFELLQGLQRDRIAIAGVLVNRVPGDSLLPKEKEALDAFFRDHPGEFVGEWSFRRLLRSQAALALLEKRILANTSYTFPVASLLEDGEESEEARASELVEQLRDVVPISLESAGVAS